MDQQTANLLFDKGGFFVLLDAPTNLEVGIDTTMWTVGPRFKGIKLIPPGVHFVYYNSGRPTVSEMRTGFFHDFQSGEVVVRQWDPDHEQLFPASHIDSDQQRRIASDIRSFDPFLGSYPLDPPKPFQMWKCLSGYIAAPLIHRIFGGSHAITSADGGPYDETPIRDNQGLAFTMIDLKRSFPSGAQGSVVTKYSQDKSWLLTHLLETAWNNDYRQLLGEMQLGFVCLLMGQNFTGFEHWKRIVHLVCLSNECIPDLAATLYPAFIDVLQHQLAACPEDFYTDIIMADNFVVQLLQTLANHVAQLPSDERLAVLQSKLGRLKAFVHDQFGWTLSLNPCLTHDSDDDETGEYAPVVVEL
ncbi:hypothetical protein H4R34_000677 [Dimargaris verticillata]|uniref:A1 cistron-splicing factor n=1 Tax=Dimargaris verticillata TaxID=2761393 RepID=A0A9W8BBD9_9FUNG|nr:hypothetical protein H4R34_000677 [Dimargaris verticillata]